MPRNRMNEIDKRHRRGIDTNSWDEQRQDDYDQWNDDRVTYGHGHNYRSNSARQGYYKPQGRAEDDFNDAENYQPHPRSVNARNARKGTRAIGDQGGASYPARQRAYGNESDHGYGGGFYGGRQGWNTNYRRESNDWDDDRGVLEKASDEVRSWFGDDEAQSRRIDDGHRGRGPRNYTRSDSRINEDVHDLLTEDSLLDASNISVTVSESEVTLDGTVHNKHAKRRAEDCVDSIPGVTHVQNNLRVE